MNKLIAAGSRYLKRMDLNDVALLKLCVGALGVLVGLGCAKRHKKGAGLVAGFLFVLTYVPLMGKFLATILDTSED